MAAFAASAEFRLGRSQLRLEQDMWLAWVRTGPDEESIKRVSGHLDDVMATSRGGRLFRLLKEKPFYSDRYERSQMLAGAARNDGILLRYLDRLGVGG